MTLGRTGLAARSTRHPFTLGFTRDRQDGGGGGSDGGDDAGDITDDTDDGDDDDSGDDPDAHGADGDDDDEGDDAPLGDAGKRALKAEREKVKAKNREIRELRAQLSAKGGGDGDDPAAAEAARVAASRELAKPIIVETKAEAMLQAAGLIGEPGRLLKLLELDDVEIEYDSRGRVKDIDGLDDQIDALKDEYPSLFAKKRGPGRIDGADPGARNPKPKPKSASELQAAGILGGRR